MKDEQAWVTTDCRQGHEGELVGNRAGLEALKSALELALQEGEAPGPEAGEWTWIRIVEKDPRERKKNPWSERFLTAGCLVVALFVLFTSVVGLIALPRLFK